MAKKLLNENLIEEFKKLENKDLGEISRESQERYGLEGLTSTQEFGKQKDITPKDRTGKSVTRQVSTPDLIKQDRGSSLAGYSDLVTSESLSETYQDLEDKREADRLERLAQEQGVIEKGLYGASKFFTRAFTTVGSSTVGLLYGTLEAVSTLDYTKIYDNDFNRMMDSAYEYVDKNTQIYQTKDAGWAEQAYNFVMDDVSDGMGFATGAILSTITGGGLVSGAGKLLGTTGKALKFSDKVSKGVKTLKEAEKASKSLSQSIARQEALSRVGKATQQLTFGTFAEAGFESRSTFDESLEKMKQNFIAHNGREPNSSELKEMEHYATRAADLTFLTNVALVGYTNLKVFPGIFNAKFLPKKNDLYKHIELQGINPKQHVKALNKLDPNNMKWSDNVIRHSKAITKNAFYEGVVEEGGQGVISGTFTDFAAASYNSGEYSFENLSDAGIEAFRHTYGSKEGFKEILVGMLIGSTGSYLPVKQKFNKETGKTEYTFSPLNFEGGIKGAYEEQSTVREDVQKIVDAVNSNPDLVKSLKNKRDNAKRQEVYSNIMDTAIEKDDEFEYHNAKDSSFLSWAYSRINIGYKDLALEELEDIKTLSPEEYKQEFGISEDEEVTQQDINNKVDELKTRFNEVVEAHNIVQDNFDGLINETGKESLIFNLSMINRYQERAGAIEQDLSNLTNNKLSLNDIFTEDVIKTTETTNKNGDKISSLELDTKIIEDNYLKFFKENSDNINVIKNQDKILKNINDFSRLKLREKRMLHEFNSVFDFIVNENNKNKDGEAISKSFEDIERNKNTFVDNELDKVETEKSSEEEEQAQEEYENEHLNNLGEDEKILENISEATNFEQSIKNLADKYQATVSYNEDTDDFDIQFDASLESDIVAARELNLRAELNNLVKLQKSTATKDDYQKLLNEIKSADTAEDVVAIFENFIGQFGAIPESIHQKIIQRYSEVSSEDKSRNRTDNNQSGANEESDVNDSSENVPQDLLPSQESEINELLEEGDIISYINNEEYLKKSNIKYIGRKIIESARTLAIHTRDFIRIKAGEDTILKKEVSDEIAQNTNPRILSSNYYTPGTKLKIKLVEDEEIDGTDNEGNPIKIKNNIGSPNQIMQVLDDKNIVVGYIRDINNINKENTAEDAKENKGNVKLQKDALTSFRFKVYDYLKKNASFEIAVTEKGTGVLMYNSDKSKRTTIKKLIENDTRPSYVYVNNTGDLTAQNSEILSLLDIPRSLEKQLPDLKGFTFIAVPSANGRYLLTPAKPSKLAEIYPADVVKSITDVLQAYLNQDSEALKSYGIESTSPSTVKEYIENFIYTSSTSTNENYLYLDIKDNTPVIMMYNPKEGASYKLSPDKLIDGELSGTQENIISRFLVNKIVHINFEKLKSNPNLFIKSRNEAEGIKSISYKEFINNTTTATIHSQEVEIDGDLERVYTHNPVIQYNTTENSKNEFIDFSEPEIKPVKKDDTTSKEEKIDVSKKQRSKKPRPGNKDNLSLSLINKSLSLKIIPYDYNSETSSGKTISDLISNEQWNLLSEEEKKKFIDCN